MRPFACAMALFCLFSGVIPAQVAGPADDPAETLRSFVIARVKEGAGELRVPYKTDAGRVVITKAISASEEGLRLSAEGKQFSVYWDELGESGLHQLCQPLLGNGTPEVTVAYLLLGVKLNHTEDKDFKALLSELWTRDAQGGLQVEDAIEASRPQKPGGEWFARVVDSGGNVNPSVYRREAYAFDAATLHRRLGPDYSFYHKDASEKFATIWKPADKTSTLNARGRAGYTYQLGDRKAPQTKSNAETSGQVLYVPDKPDDPGIDRINTWDWQLDTQGHHSFIMMPEPCSGQSHPEPGVLERSWKEAAGGRIGPPVAAARGLGFKVCSVTAFASGLIGAAGTNTSGFSNSCLLLPRNKAPTGVAVTNGSEFALVTVWDTAALKGQVAVIALESSLNARNPGNALRPQSCPGIWNWGIVTGMKLLGFVDLPGMNAPTEIAAVGNKQNQECHLNGAWVSLDKVDLSKPSVRESYWKGENKDQCQTAGFAVVVSKYDRKAAFLDLRPLFQYYREMYFASAKNFEKTRKLGPGPKEWPYTFEGEPRCRPRVVSTVTLPSPPTAVHASPFGGSARARAFIATLDGKIRIYSVGGLADETPTVPPDVRCVGVVPVGRNPTRIAYVQWDWDYRLDELIVCSRGDREICFVKLDAALNSGKVTKRLRDSRLLDPVSVENTTTAFNHCFLITITDFKGRQVISYRYGAFTTIDAPKVTFAMGPDGKSEFECGGWMFFPGRPFRLTSANVP